jgi:hypothetical protein
VRVGLGVGRVDDRQHVDAEAVRVAGQLVGEGDVDVAVSRLGELAQLGGLGGAQPADLGVEERRVQLDAARLAVRREAADELRVRVEVGDRPAAEDALG